MTLVERATTAEKAEAWDRLMHDDTSLSLDYALAAAYDWLCAVVKAREANNHKEA